MTEESYNDDADVSHLETRIDELEETIRQMLPSRREAIGMGVAGLAGASLMSGTASAGSAQVGTIGDSNNLVDLVAEDVTITDTLNTASLASAPAGEALLSDGNGNLQFGAAGGVEEVSTFSNLPTVDPPQIAFVIDEGEYYISSETANAFSGSNLTLQDSLTRSDEPIALHFSEDGSNLYVSLWDGSLGSVEQFSLGTPFDLSTASLVGNKTVEEVFTSSIHLSPDGTKFFEMGGDTIHQFTLSTAFDITSSGSPDGTFTSGAMDGVTFSEDGKKMVLVDNQPTDGARMVTLENSFDVTDDFTIQTGVHHHFVNSFADCAWADDGFKFISCGRGDIRIIESYIPYDIGGLGSLPDGFSLADAESVIFNKDGTKLYEADSNGSKVNEYSVNNLAGWIEI